MHGFLRISALLFALLASALLTTAASAENVFEVANIHVDASAKSVAEARNTAIAAGRPIAWATLYRRLTRQADWARQPVLDAVALQRLVIGYFPSNERRSTTRYVADLTYTFNPDAVARVLQAAGIPYTTTAVKRILVIPMAPGFNHGSAWTAAFASQRFANAPVLFAVPAGDAQDAAVLGGLNFETASWEHIAAVAARIHATEAVLVLAQPVGNKLVLTLKRLGAGTLPSKVAVDVPLMQGAVATYPSAADAAVRAIDEMWKTQKVVDFSQKGKLLADAHFASLGQFANLENAIAAVPNVSAVNVAAMDIGQARLAITYIGTTEQLRAALAQSGVTLTARGAVWSIGTAQAQP
jgi:hypothetical protein